MPDKELKEKLQSIDDCSENLRIIKELLFEVNIKTIYERWAFYMWGILIILGGITHFIIEIFFNLKPMEYAVFIWVPLMILAGLFELISFIRNLSKHSLSIFSRPIIKFFLGLFLQTVMPLFTCIFLIQNQHYDFIPIFLTFAVTGFFVLYSVSIHIYYLLPAGFLSAFAVILFFISIPTQIVVLVCSLGIGISWISGGFICYFLEKEE